MTRYIAVAICIFLLFAHGARGQDNAVAPQGFDLGRVHFDPHAGASVAHDNRVGYDDSTGTAEADVYTDAEAGISFYNQPAMFSLSGKARYGYRYYNESADLSDDFYDLGISINSAPGPWDFYVSSDLRKSLSYNAKYDPATGEQPDSILTDQVNQRVLSSAGIAYTRPVSERFSIRPAYSLNHYYQNFDGGGTAEWQIHAASLRFNHKYSEKTRFYSTAAYDLQVNDDEDGVIGKILFGADGQTTEKTSWVAEAGYAIADYEQSGTDRGLVSNLRGNWQVTDKVGGYVFGGNDFQPGYGGGPARRVYRAGYGIIWSPIDRVNLQGSVLHDYQETVGDGVSADPAIGEVRHFAEARINYALARHWQVSTAFRYVNDEIPVDQGIVLASVEYAY